jgi:hypothetical protein
LELESLEDRIAPVVFGGTGSFADDLMGNLPTFSRTTFTPSFPGTIPSFGTAGFFAAGGSLTGLNSAAATNASSAGVGTTNQLAQLEQMIVPLYQLAAAQNAPAATSLVIDEVFLALDTFTVFMSQEHGIFSPTFQDLPARENSINANPLQQTPIGRLLGSAVFEATANLLATRLPGAGVAV